MKEEIKEKNRKGIVDILIHLLNLNKYNAKNIENILISYIVIFNEIEFSDTQKKNLSRLFFNFYDRVDNPFMFPLKKIDELLSYLDNKKTDYKIMIDNYIAILNPDTESKKIAELINYLYEDKYNKINMKFIEDIHEKLDNIRNNRIMKWFDILLDIDPSKQRNMNHKIPSEEEMKKTIILNLFESHNLDKKIILKVAIKFWNTKYSKELINYIDVIFNNFLKNNLNEFNVQIKLICELILKIRLEDNSIIYDSTILLMRKVFNRIQKKQKLLDFLIAFFFLILYSKNINKYIAHLNDIFSKLNEENKINFIEYLLKKNLYYENIEILKNMLYNEIRKNPNENWRLFVFLRKKRIDKFSIHEIENILKNLLNIYTSDETYILDSICTMKLKKEEVSYLQQNLINYIQNTIDWNRKFFTYKIIMQIGECSKSQKIKKNTINLLFNNFILLNDNQKLGYCARRYLENINEKEIGKKFDLDYFNEKLEKAKDEIKFPQNQNSQGYKIAKEFYSVLEVIEEEINKKVRK